MAELAFAFRTLSCVLPDKRADVQALGWATAGMGMQAKNLKHNALFAVRNIFSLFDHNGRLKTGARGVSRPSRK